MSIPDHWQDVARFVADADAARHQMLAAFAAAGTHAELAAAQAEWLGRKSGRVNAFLDAIPHLPADQRRVAGPAANALREAGRARAAERERELAATAAHDAPTLDLTMP
ncbi:MAG TPA: hypothetical protein VFG84_12350, partial [Gemmatimonadaceae bacterium]|nr:hypothetical protein [Gemmatimonadaceae bacterium]